MDQSNKGFEDRITTMRFLVLTADYPRRNHVWSGIGTAVAQQVGAVAQLGYEVCVVSPALAGVEQPYGSPRLHALSRDRFPCDVGHADVVHIHSLALSELGMEIAKRFGSRLVYTAHSLPGREFGDSATGVKWTCVQDKIMARADRIFFLHPEDQSRAVERNAALQHRSSLLAHGVAGRMFPQSPRERIALFAGRFALSKGIDIAVRVFEALVKSTAGWQFLFAGGHGGPAETEMVRRLCDRFPQSCRATGWLSRDAMDALYARSSLLLMPSRYEPFGMVALEALRLGLPVLASAALRNLLPADSGATIVPGESTSAWVSATLPLMADDAARGRLAALGPEFSRRHFDPMELARCYVREVAA
jgi:glycosyltransferase involved in cell wall biosynthesis